MATKTINVTVGAVVGGVVQKSTGQHAGASSGSATLTYDDTAITTLAHMKSVLDEMWFQAQSNKDLKH